MTLTMELTEEQEKRLAAQANGKSLEQFAKEILAEVAERPMTGAELVAYWEREGLVGIFKDAPDSPEFARQLRESAERRDHVG